MTEAKVDAGRPRVADRPLSPHLMAWRPHITMTVSILHRMTGVALYGGWLIIAGWAAALASGGDCYLHYRALLGSPAGKLVLLGLTFSVFYHLAGGLRHLAWDLGFGFEPRVADTTATAVIAFGITATMAVWGIAFLVGVV
jgi:succinate dehydrogenase / fumarate reductase cytochrome b subunit